MSLQVIQNQIGYVDPTVAILDTGWSISGSLANHVPCNSGNIISLTPLGLEVGHTYTFSYVISNYVSGNVNIIAGTNNGGNRTANGAYSDTLEVTDIAQLAFFSDGNLSVQNLAFYDVAEGLQSGATVSFNERENKWTSDYSFQPELIVKFIDSLLTVKNGQLWLHNSNPVCGSFYGVNYPAQVVFISNKEYNKNKLWFNLRLDSTGAWYVANMTVTPNDQFPNGMQTMMTSKNMKSIDGKLWADILRDMNDPNFYEISDPSLRSAVSMFQGRMMQGGWVITTLQNNDTTAATLASAELYYIDVNKSL